MMRVPTTLLLGTLPLAALVGCDDVARPEASRIEIIASRARLDATGDTLMLGAEVRNDRGEELANADVSWESESPDVAVIEPTGLLTAVSNGTTRVVARSDDAMASLEMTVNAVIACAPVGEVEVTDTVSGSVVEGDCRVQGGAGDFWRLTLAEEMEISLEGRSPELDASLILFDGRGDVIAVDQDRGIGPASRIFRALTPDTYFILATSIAAAERGPYDLSIFEGRHPSPCPARGPIGFPDTTIARVSASACVYDRFAVHVWRLDLDRDTTVMLEVASDELTPAIELKDTLGTPLAGSAHGPSTTGCGAPDGTCRTARLELPLSAGSYHVWVGDAATPGKFGAYTLSTRAP